MDIKPDILKDLDRFDYLDLHTHLEDCPEGDLATGILYFASSMDRLSWEKTADLARRNRAVLPLCGIHPMRAREALSDLPSLLGAAEGIPLIGEIGLDFHWVEDRSGDEAQRRVFREFLALASRTGAPPTIHTKGAEGEILEELRRHSITNALIHWYSGPQELIPLYLEQGCYFTAGPDVFSGSPVCSLVPPDRLFCETDYPTGMPWICGGESRTDDIIRVYEQTALLLGTEVSRLADRLKENLINWLG
ncbi:MAG: TatD family hydrolase [Spirochaetales bacterium]|nr:TatD family hydrolase [Spirochaetales bacterium]